MHPFVINGASGRSRTGTPVKARDFKTVSKPSTGIDLQCKTMKQKENDEA